MCVKQNCYFVPISKVLKNLLLRNDQVLSQIFEIEYNKMLRKLTDNCLLVDIQQAKSFEKNGTLFNMPLPINVEMTSQSFKLCLQLYSDDFEPASPIGWTMHKGTCYYWILPKLPPWLTSQSSAINVAAFCNTLDLYRYGYKKILSRTIKDLESLEQPFNVVTDTGRKIILTGAHFSFIDDNAEYHSALGFGKTFF